MKEMRSKVEKILDVRMPIKKLWFKGALDDLEKKEQDHFYQMSQREKKVVEFVDDNESLSVDLDQNKVEDVDVTINHQDEDESLKQNEMPHEIEKDSDQVFEDQVMRVMKVGLDKEEQDINDESSDSHDEDDI